MSSRAFIAAMALSLSAACGSTTDGGDAPGTRGPNGPVDGKADGPGDQTVFEGACAADAPTVPYQPVPEPTRAQPNGPDVLHTRIGVPLAVDYDAPTPITGEFLDGDCGRHYFVFTLDRAALLGVRGSSVMGTSPTGLELCFVRPEFLRIDTPWYADIWEKQSYTDPAPPCGTFVPVGTTLEPASGESMELGPGSYELTIDPIMGATTYDLELVFEPIGSAVCGDAIRDPGEGCDDGNQDPLDWCGADCRPQRLDLEPIPGNETADTAQPVDGFRTLNFYAPAGDKEVDVYAIDMHAGESIDLRRGERICRDTIVQLYSPEGAPLAEPWTCATMDDAGSLTVSRDGRYFLRLETAEDGARSVSARILP